MQFSYHFWVDASACGTRRSVLLSNFRSMFFDDGEYILVIFSFARIILRQGLRAVLGDARVHEYTYGTVEELILSLGNVFAMLLPH